MNKGKKIRNKRKGNKERMFIGQRTSQYTFVLYF